MVERDRVNVTPEMVREAVNNSKKDSDVTSIWKDTDARLFSLTPASKVTCLGKYVQSS